MLVAQTGRKKGILDKYVNKGFRIYGSTIAVLVVVEAAVITEVVAVAEVAVVIVVDVHDALDDDACTYLGQDRRGVQGYRYQRRRKQY